MRPYMLWLTRVYGRSITGYGTAFMAWPNVLDDWLRRCAEDRYRNERAIQLALRATRAVPGPSHHMSMPRKSPRRVAREYAALRRARAAGQGGR